MLVLCKRTLCRLVNQNCAMIQLNFPVQVPMNCAPNGPCLRSGPRYLEDAGPKAGSSTHKVSHQDASQWPARKCGSVKCRPPQTHNAYQVHRLALTSGPFYGSPRKLCPTPSGFSRPTTASGTSSGCLNKDNIAIAGEVREPAKRFRI